LAGIKFTNPSLTNRVGVESDPSDRHSRVVIYDFAPGETKYIDEINLMPALDTFEQFQSALRGGILTIIEADLDKLSTIEYAQFLAEGLGVKYFYTTNDILTGKAVGYDEQNGTLQLLDADGDKPVGILRQAAVKYVYTRVKTEGLTSAVAGADIKMGDTLIAKTDGTVIATTDQVNQNKYMIGVANNDALIGELVTFIIDIKLI